jgi:hypothetical protein
MRRGAVLGDAAYAEPGDLIMPEGRSEFEAEGTPSDPQLLEVQ